MFSVHCVFQKVIIERKGQKNEEFDMLISIHETERKAHKEVNKLNAKQKEFYFPQIWNVQ